MLVHNADANYNACVEQFRVARRPRSVSVWVGLGILLIRVAPRDICEPPRADRPQSGLYSVCTMCEEWTGTRTVAMVVKLLRYCRVCGSSKLRSAELQTGPRFHRYDTSNRTSVFMEIRQKILTPHAPPFKVTALTVNGVGTDQSAIYNFLFVFPSNYGLISYIPFQR